MIIVYECFEKCVLPLICDHSQCVQCCGAYSQFSTQIRLRLQLRLLL